jgi:myosin-crossreactive antigen
MKTEDLPEDIKQMLDQVIHTTQVWMILEGGYYEAYHNECYYEVLHSWSDNFTTILIIDTAHADDHGARAILLAVFQGLDEDHPQCNTINLDNNIKTLISITQTFDGFTQIILEQPPY